MTRAVVPSVDPQTADVTSVETRHGPARVRVLSPEDAAAASTSGLVILTHGSAGDATAPDLLVTAFVAREAGFVVALVDQPYRIAGRRVPPRSTAVDEAWIDVVSALRTRIPGGVLATGGRSFGARVACRGAHATGADAVLALAFPTLPPGADPEKTRLPELVAVEVPTLVLCGDRDPFGRPEPNDLPDHIRLVVVPGDHALRSRAASAGVRDAVASFLSTLRRP